MYEVKYTDANGETFAREFNELTQAMEWAKTVSEFVTITGGELVIVGKFGVDAVTEGVLPNGFTYDWKKRRI